MWLSFCVFELKGSRGMTTADSPVSQQTKGVNTIGAGVAEQSLAF